MEQKYNLQLVSSAGGRFRFADVKQEMLPLAYTEAENISFSGGCCMTCDQMPGKCDGRGCEQAQYNMEAGKPDVMVSLFAQEIQKHAVYIMAQMQSVEADSLTIRLTEKSRFLQLPRGKAKK